MRSKKEISVLKETNQDEEMITAYKEAMEAYKDGDLFFSSKKFLEAELLFPQSIWAPKVCSDGKNICIILMVFMQSQFQIEERYLKTYNKG